MDIIKINSKDDRYPERLLKIKNYPSEIYTLGDINLLKSKYTVGIVGARNCTEYGRKVSYEFSKEISKNRICVISGLAVGIDAMAHNGAIEENGKTIAVLGSGFNYIYPKENEWLFHKILENGGCIITEYSPNVEPDIKKIPKRNRIIAGLSDKVLVVEAEYRSGSSITIKYAKKQGKIVYAIPSNIYSYSGIGTNIMIQNGAKLVMKSDEIIDDIKEKYKFTNKKNIEEKYIPICKLLS